MRIRNLHLVSLVSAACALGLAGLSALNGCNPRALLEGDNPFELSCPGVGVHGGRVGTFLVIGHRGAAAKAVENTLPSMRTAMDEGANAVEIDLSMTSEGVVVLWHDWDPDDEIALGRQSGSESGVAYRPRVPPVGDSFRRKVSSLSLDDLRAHYGYQKISGEPADGVEIPTFKSFVDWAASEPRLKALVIDVKIPAAEADVAASYLDKIEAELGRLPDTEVILSTPHDEVWQVLRPRLGATRGLALEIDPGVVVLDDQRCSASSSKRAETIPLGYASTVLPKGVPSEAWNAFTSLLRCDLETRDRNPPSESSERPVEKVLAATLDDQKQLECVTDLGVDGIVTDEPAALARLARAKGRKL